MKVPKFKPITATFYDGTEYCPEVPTWDVEEYPHDSLLLKEVASIVFNKRLKIQERRRWDSMGMEIVMELTANSPYKASLKNVMNLSDMDMITSKGATKQIKEHTYRQMVEELLSEAMESVHTVHKLKRSFLERLKYLFNANRTGKYKGMAKEQPDKN